MKNFFMESENPVKQRELAKMNKTRPRKTSSKEIYHAARSPWVEANKALYCFLVVVFNQINFLTLEAKRGNAGEEHRCGIQRFPFLYYSLG